MLLLLHRHLQEVRICWKADLFCSIGIYHIHLVLGLIGSSQLDGLGDCLGIQVPEGGGVRIGVIKVAGKVELVLLLLQPTIIDLIRWLPLRAIVKCLHEIP